VGTAKWLSQVIQGHQSSFVTLVLALFIKKIETEKMFELLETNLEVKDIEDALPLHVKGGTIEFKNVRFSYSTQSADEDQSQKGTIWSYLSHKVFRTTWGFFHSARWKNFGNCWTGIETPLLFDA
jgi:hypothetical protein